MYLQLIRKGASSAEWVGMATFKAVGALEGAGATEIAARVLAAVGLNYVLTLGAASLAAVALSLAGMARSEAVTLSVMLGFVFYVVVVVWVFQARSSTRAAALIIAGAALAHASAFVLARLLPQVAAAGGPTP